MGGRAAKAPRGAVGASSRARRARRPVLAACVLAAAMLAPSQQAFAGHGLTYAAHELGYGSSSAGTATSTGLTTTLLDHPAPAFIPPSPPSSTINSGGNNANWKLIDTVATGNPHTDIEFFTQGGETYVSAGTLGAGANSGGQTIVQLTDGNQIDPQFVSSHPSASCVSDPSAALGLQHDVEAAPKGNPPFNIRNPFADRRGAQLLLDATDNPGRCHDQGEGGIAGAPQGGLEIIDITDIENPVEIGLTSHIGESHTVNVDPKRPHIAYSVTSDAVGVTDGKRTNQDPNGDTRDLDGFEVVDFSSCMDFPNGTSVAEKRQQCRPEVYRYRYPFTRMAIGHTIRSGGSAIFGCHELEVYPSDLLTCGSGNALIGLDMSGAFNDRGTPNDFSDDKPRGEPLPCTVRASSTAGLTTTGAKVTDCVNGEGTGADDLNVARWLSGPTERLRGVRWLGSVNHMGGGPSQTSPPFGAGRDIAFNHESELSASGRYLMATDERGGGVTPPGAACSPEVNNRNGNGGVHFYKFGRLTRDSPGSPREARRAYALKDKPGHRKAIFRAPIHTEPQATLCTAHVFQQIPGQNRIFMGWYSQGTQVFDFHEKANGRIDFDYVGWLIPENANTWTSHIFDWEQRDSGRWTYWGATGDFTLGTDGRSAIDVYKVTLPAPPDPKPPTPNLCRERWEMLHGAGGRPFDSRDDCLRAAA